MISLKHLYLSTALTALLAGCAMPPMGPPPVHQSLPSHTPTSAPIGAAQQRLEEAQVLMAQGQKQQALALLQGIDLAILPPSLQFDIIKLQTEDALARHNPQQALSYLANMPATGTLPEQAQLISQELYAEAYRLSGQPLEEAKALISSYRESDDPVFRQSNHDRIWQALQQVSDQELYLALQQANNYLLQGWLELAQATRTFANTSSQTSNLQDWVSLWPTHPAAALLPLALTGQKSSELIHAGKIVVLLPASGPLAKAAKAIEAGIRTAHQLDGNTSGTTPALEFIDSTLYTSGDDLLQATQGADLVIGPLDKEKVMVLSQLSSLPTPFLALNYVDNSTINLYQFGLSAEDEARDVATRAFNDGHQRAIILTPGSSWGLRAADAFDRAFSSLGGEIVGRKAFSRKSLSKDIASVLRVNYNRDRERKTGKSIPLSQRRRQDVDVVLLAARPVEARLVKPMLNFYFAKNLPVYATSQIYSGTPSPSADNDLNGVYFGDIPWVLAPASAYRQTMDASHPGTGTRFGRLYAMGIDAYRLYPYLQQLGASNIMELDGETGVLSIDMSNKVHRQLNWAVFQGGKPRPVE